MGGRQTRAYGTYAIALAMTVVTLAGCGSGDDSSDVAAPPPSDPDAPATGTLHTFTYGDTVSDPLVDPFLAANPDLDLQTATFDSVQAGAAKVAGGFKTDVIQPCADEYQPLIQRNILQPIDPDGIENWDELKFRDSEGILRDDGLVNFVPIAAGPQGIIYNTDEVSEPPTSWADLFDPQYAGRAGIDGGTYLTPIAEAGMAMGVSDPMAMTDEEVEEAKVFLIDHRDQFRSFISSDADKVNLFKSGEIVISDGGRGSAKALQDAGVPVEWVAPEEGAMAWVCGLGITADAENIDAAYKLINYYVSDEGQELIAQGGLTVVNPSVMPSIPKEFRFTADPSSLTDVIAEVQPDNYQTWVRAWQEVKAGG
ncbi:MAG TPA: extracellular solute-binding protein [Solirubrobacterales bacterium]|nr:extracellular solute-binding protein [Solirubrobacterales bacterium]